MNKNLSAQGGPAWGGKIVGIIVLLIAITAGGWFLVGKKSQNGTNLTQKNVEIKNEKQPQEKHIVDNKELIKVFEDNKNVTDFEKIDTSTWKTYKNNILGYQISYPKGWKITVEDHWGASSSMGLAITKKKKCNNSIYRCKEKIVGLDITPALIRNHTTKNDKDKLLNFSADFLDNTVVHYRDFGTEDWSGCEFEIKPIYYDNITKLRFLFYPSDIRDEDDLKIRKEILKTFKLIKK